jgi:hypothetical protein
MRQEGTRFKGEVEANQSRLFRLLRLFGSFAFFDDLLLRLARHFFVVAEGFRVHAPAAGE